MTDPPTSQAELQDRVHQLEQRVQALRDEVERERVARETSESLLDRAADGAFTAQVDEQGRIISVWVDESMPVQRDVLQSVLQSEPVPAHCRHVVNTGRPVRFLVEPNGSDSNGTVDAPSGDATTSGMGAEETTLDASVEAWDVTLVSVRAAEASLFELPLSQGDGGIVDGASYVRGILRTATAQAGQRVLRESHALQHELVELLPDAILIVGSDDRILFSNSAALKMVGASDEDAVHGTKIWDHVHPGSRARTRKWKDRIRRGAPIDFAEHKLIRQDGSSRPVETASVPIVYRGQRAALIAVRDLAGRQRMAETIQHTLDLFDKAFHLGPSALLIVRVRDGMILEVSDRMVEFAGQDARDLLGGAMAQTEVSLPHASLKDLSRELIREGAIHDRELQVDLPDGRSRVVLLSARLTEIDHAVCALVSLVDVTERKKAAVAVRESRTLLDKIFRASPAPIAICRLDDWQYLDVNDAMCSLIGFPHDEIVGHTPGNLGLWVDSDCEDDLTERLSEQDAVYDFEARFRRSDGSTVTTLSSFQRISVEGEECVLAVMTDITQREEKKQALIEAKERAEEIAQFRSTVLSNMTHEVRTPLTVILGFTSILSEGVSEDYRRFVNLIERSGRRLLLTLDSLLDLAQLEAGTLEPDMEIQSVSDAITRMTASHRKIAEEKNLSFAVDVPDMHVFAEFDFELLGRVMNHLVDNAMKFTTEGAIKVIVEEVDSDLTIRVRDTGPGIDESFQTRIFDAFAQESEGNTRSHQGSGLGLTVSKRIVECMDGELFIESAKGQGTEVTITFPVISVDD
ncbi:hypothetical protein CRI94_05890 [Longibacter salinarum]|uniref:histidine kinase n=1 Tax=Longibacter salinarum TaxID=1850348 RepID=A0A2A8D0U8_9BACT|nr:PAS domain S-box protein [Longibacter salinarum]PEN14555.1 hypothetical protein CRI94_05890 [Longibacter salinarum]